MARRCAIGLLSFSLYLLLTTATGTIGIWSAEELLIGVVVATLVALLSARLVKSDWARILSIRRVLLLGIYLLGPFFWAMAKANIDVVYRVITGHINPGIIRIAPGLATDASTAFLANSITLTPGTLTVDVDEKTNDLYVHWINVDESSLKTTPRDYHRVCGTFPNWARRIAG